MTDDHPLGLTPGEDFAAAMYRQPEGRANEPCPRPCTGCGPEHHWLDAAAYPSDDADFEPDDGIPKEMQERADIAAEPEMYWACKHCSAWRPIEGPCSECGKATMNPYRRCRACGGQHDMA